MLLVGGGPAGAGSAGVPRPDHVVVVVEENRSYGDIVGNASAPFLQQLAAGGALFTNSYALLPGSQPNYVGLFSGSFQGVQDNSCPHTFAAPSLGGQLLAAGLGFTGYAQTLPSVGYTGCSAGEYVRRHNPWVDFSDVPAAANRPFSDFPSDYSTLPAVSFVVPDLADDMHDGTIAAGDTWLSTNLGAYANWATTHNSLLVVTFDEDNGRSAEHIPTIVYGANVQPGQYGATITHYSVLRLLEDAFGLAPLGAAAGVAPILDIWAPPAGDTAPTAAFTPTCTGLTCTFDATAATDPDGTIVGYLWGFGDGTTSADAAPQHTFPTGGPWRVQLTVTDDAGATSTATQQVWVSDPAAFAADTLARTVAGGFGTADTGGDWSVAGAPASAFSVSEGTASMSAAAAPATLTATLGAVRRIDADVRLTIGLSAVPAGGPITLSVSGRKVTASTEYAARLVLRTDHSVALRVVRVVNGTETVLAEQSRVIGLDAAAAGAIDVRLQVTGTSPTLVRAKAWPPRDAEPAAWQVSSTDSAAALQGPGGVGVGLSLNAAVTSLPVAAVIGPLSVSRTGDSAPVASFSPSCAQLACSFDASASTDYDGSIASYDWAFGDGATGSGSTVQHTYAASGSYPVTLTVTDDESAATTVTRSVVVGDALGQDAFARTVSGGWGTADVGGPWTVTGSASAFAVAPGRASMTLRTSPTRLGACLCAVSATATDVTATVSPAAVPTSATAYFEVEGRHLATRTGYAAKLVLYPDRSMTLRIVRVQSGTETIIGAPLRVPGATVAAGRSYTVRFQVTGTGPTTLRAKAWTATGSEPAAWLVSATDTVAALQAPGAVGVVSILPGSVKPLPFTFGVTAFRVVAP